MKSPHLNPVVLPPPTCEPQALEEREETYLPTGIHPHYGEQGLACMCPMVTSLWQGGVKSCGAYPTDPPPELPGY